MRKKINLPMTIEEQIEEILIESSAYGIRLEVIKSAAAIIDANPQIKKIEAYHIAFNQYVK